MESEGKDRAGEGEGDIRGEVGVVGRGDSAGAAVAGADS